MSAPDDIRTELERAGAVLVRADFLDSNGKLKTVGVDVPVADLLVTKDAIAYWPIEGDRVHAQRIQKIRERGSDEWELINEDGDIVLVVSSIWTPAQKRAVADWAKAPAALRKNIQASLEEMLDALSR